MACLDCVVDLEDVVVCGNAGTVRLPIVATSAGEHTLVIEFGRARLTHTLFHDSGETLEFDVSDLNEDYCYFGYVLGPDGLRVMFDAEGQERGKFKFCTKQQFTL